MAVTWTITDHVCRVCLGRLLTTNEGGIHTVRCADCGLEAVGRVAALCVCGTKLKTGRDAGMRCQRNPDPRPECSAEIVASLADVAAMSDGDHGTSASADGTSATGGNASPVSVNA